MPMMSRCQRMVMTGCIFPLNFASSFDSQPHKYDNIARNSEKEHQQDEYISYILMQIGMEAHKKDCIT